MLRWLQLLRRGPHYVMAEKNMVNLHVRPLANYIKPSLPRTCHSRYRFQERATLLSDLNFQ